MFQNLYVHLKTSGIKKLFARAHVTDPPGDLPKIIWIFWDGGLATAPEVVQICIKSWQRYNPDWDIRVLDAQSVRQYSTRWDDYPDSMSKNHRSDLLRTDLLAKFGGVWADATTLCTKPLDCWLPALMQGHFFVYHRPGTDRPISTWFIAASSNSVLAREYDRACVAHWINRASQKKYFWFHYTFEAMLLRDKTCRRLYRHIPKISANAPHALQNAHQTGAFDISFLENYAADAIPVHKLTWKMESFDLGPALAWADPTVYPLK